LLIGIRRATRLINGFSGGTLGISARTKPLIAAAKTGTVMTGRSKINHS
jgi:hypothetical protein